MLHARDSSSPESQEDTACSPELTAYLSISGREWHSTPRIRSPVLTSTCICSQQNHILILVRQKFSFGVFKDSLIIGELVTLSYSCSVPRLARPPRKREVPSTSNKLDKTEPSREHFTTTTLPSYSAKIAMMTSVTFPNVAFNSPPTAIYSGRLGNNVKVVPWIRRLNLTVFFFFYQ